ncbi:MAG: T9SS type A sorting domain-containing protein [Bacteroidia bacterium]|nr:T9SS type A sorting domain-containing protein [Bacteroidia bacterium]
MRATYLFLFLVFVVSSGSAQNVTFTKVWEKVYGGLAEEKAYNLNLLHLDQDSNIIITAGSQSDVGGNKTSANCVGTILFNSDFWLIKLDQNGNKIFDNSYGSSNNEFLDDVVLLADGSIVMLGTSDSPIECYKSQNRFSTNPDVWLVKVDTNGGKVWDKRYGTTATDWVYNIIKSPNSGFLIAAACGGVTSPGNITSTSNGSLDITLINVDSNGIKQWDKMYGGIGAEFGNITATKDQNYLLAGLTTSWLPGGDISTTNIGGNGNTHSDGWVIKLDTTGNILWEHRYGCQNDDGFITGFEDVRGDYVAVGIVAGSCEGGNVTDTLDRGVTDIWLVKLNPVTGTITYDRRIGGNGYDACYQIIETSDGGYLLACLSNSDVGFEKSEPRIVPANPNLYQLWEDFWIVKTDSMFNVQWDKTIGGSDLEKSPCLLLLNDSTFILAGASNSPISGDKTIAKFDTLGGINGSGGDIWVMKFTTSSITSINEFTAPQFSVYPNPVTDVLYVSPKKQLNTNAIISIIDLQGREIMQQKVVQNTTTVIPIAVSTIEQGVYLVKLNGQLQRFIKL